jgi:glycosyltransferase involved in cell wall biosynthesis
MISVVVPAHDEAEVILDCLRALCDGADPGELEVLVVCNGCSDATADRARSVGPPVQVHELATASKVEALNHGDRAASGFPRFYVDADVVMPLSSLRRIAEVLRAGDLVAAAPGVRMDTDRSSHIVRSYFRIWARLPAVADDIVGRGVYAVDRNGRQRFGAFPDLVADDQFIRATFTRTERGSVPGAWAMVRAPRSLPGLVRRRARVHAGNVEMAGHVAVDSPATGPRTILEIVRQDPARVLDVPAFVFVTALVRARSRIRPRQGRDWVRDDSRPIPAAER